MKFPNRRWRRKLSDALPRAAVTVIPAVAGVGAGVMVLLTTLSLYNLYRSWWTGIVAFIIAFLSALVLAVLTGLSFAISVVEEAEDEADGE